MDSGTDWLSEILQNVQLEQFYVPIRDQLQITRLAHFDYVHTDDLERIGISKPGIRRLFDAVRKKKLMLWNRKFWNKLFGSSSSVKEKADIALKPIPQAESKTTCIILEKDIVLNNELGTGSFGVVKKGEWRISDQRIVPVAVKVLKADAFSQPGIYDDFRREVEAMHSLKHQNLIKLHGVVFHPLMMVCELAPMGALLDYIRAQNSKVSLNYILKWSMQVAAGMAHLEKSRFLHRDLACRNILLTNLELVKIGDFGLMRALPDADDYYVMSERRRVPFPWCAPESLRTRQFSHASDVWMFAVALWEMYTFGEEPWIGLNGSEILRLIMREGQRLPAPGACPPDVYMLMMQCWDLSPKERPTFAGIQRYMETNKFETAVAALSYRRQGQMSVESGDAIVLIDRRPELHWWKGQNQRTLEVGLFPSSLVTTGKSKNSSSAKKCETLSPVQRALTTQSNGQIQISEDSAVVLRKRRTIESTQPSSTRADKSGGKHFNYNKLINDRATLSLGSRVARRARDAYSKSLNQVKEDLLIDLELPPCTKASSLSKRSANFNTSILDEPIDVPELGLEADWAPQSTESLPTYSTHQQNVQTHTNIYGAKSMDNLATPPTSTSQDPFDTSQLWDPEQRASRPGHDTPHRSNYDTQSVSRPSYEIQVDPSRYRYETQKEPSVSQNESQRYSSNDTQLYNNRTPTRNNSIANNSPYGAVQTYAHTKALSLERNVPNMDNNGINMSNISTSLADMSLDDRISESLNLRSKNSNGENIYSNSPYHTPPPAGPSNVANEYSDIPLYSNTNFEINPTQQQFLLETKDYYTKLSTPSKVNRNNYEKNIYDPKYEDEAEKLKNFSDNLENSKNYSAFKYQNVDYACSTYSDYGVNTPRDAVYGVTASHGAMYGLNTPQDAVYGISSSQGADYGVNTPRDAAYGVTSSQGADYGVNTPRDAVYGVTSSQGADYVVNTPQDAVYGVTSSQGADYGVNTPQDAVYGVTSSQGADYGVNTPQGAVYGVNGPRGAVYGMNATPGAVYGMNATPGAVYDIVNDTESNFYSEIGDAAGTLYATQHLYANRGLYDEVYDDTPRPHRPAPPCPAQPK